MSGPEPLLKLVFFGVTETTLLLEVTVASGGTKTSTLNRGEGDGFNCRGLYMPEPSRVAVQTCSFLIESPDKKLFYLDVETDDAEAVFGQLAETPRKKFEAVAFAPYFLQAA